MGENQKKKKIEIAMDMDDESEDEFFDEHEHDAFTTSNPSMSESVDRIDQANDIGKSGYVQRFEPNLPSNLRVEDMSQSSDDEERKSNSPVPVPVEEKKA